MDDHHDINDPGLNSSFSYDNFERTSIDGDGERLDYCKEEVRNYYGRFILELCHKYDIDGIEFDYLRTCPIMSCVNDETTNTLTEYMRSLKEEAEKIANKKISSFSIVDNINKSIYCCESGCLANSNCKEIEVGYFNAEFMPDKCELH